MIAINLTFLGIIVISLSIITGLMVYNSILKIMKDFGYKTIFCVFMCIFIFLNSVFATSGVIYGSKLLGTFIAFEDSGLVATGNIKKGSPIFSIVDKQIILDKIGDK